MSVPPSAASPALLRAAALARTAAVCPGPRVGPREVLLKAIELALDEKLQRAARALTSNAPIASGGDGLIAAVLIKPVSDLCNLRCTYCYEGEGEERVGTQRMPLRLLEKVIADACEQACGTVEFLWHGGEPLLAGQALFEHGIRVQKRYARRGLKIRNAVQTNGLLLDDKWLQLFRREKFGVGISLDGPPPLHDASRIDTRGRGTATRVEGAISRLQKAGVPFGVISVIGSRHVGRADAYLEYLLQLGVTHLDVHPDARLASERVIGIEPRAFAEFCIDLFDLWLRSGSLTLRINLFDDFLRGYLGLNPQTCYFSGSCTRVVAVEASGDVVPCTRPFDRAKFTFGNLTTQTLDTVVRSASMRRFAELDETAQSRAADCMWHHLCHAGCPQHRADIGSQQRLDAGNLYCDCDGRLGGGYATVWAHIASRLEAVVVGGVADAPATRARPLHWLRAEP